MHPPSCYRCDARVTRVLFVRPYSTIYPLGACVKHGPAGALRLPPIGPRMLLALSYISGHPGCAKLAAVQGAHCPSQARGYESIDRLLRHGYVKDMGHRNRARLATTDLGDAMLSLAGDHV